MTAPRYTLEEIREYAARNAPHRPEWNKVAAWSDEELVARLGKTTRTSTALASLRWYFANEDVAETAEAPAAPEAEPVPALRSFAELVALPTFADFEAISAEELTALPKEERAKISKRKSYLKKREGV